MLSWVSPVELPHPETEWAIVQPHRPIIGQGLPQGRKLGRPLPQAGGEFQKNTAVSYQLAALPSAGGTLTGIGMVAVGNLSTPCTLVRALGGLLPSRNFLVIYLMISWGVGKESVCNVGDLGSMPGLGRALGEGKGYPLQYSGLENTVDCIDHEVTKSWTRLSDFHLRIQEANCCHFSLNNK